MTTRAETTLRPPRSTTGPFPLFPPAPAMLRAGEAPLSALKKTAALSAPTVSYKNQHACAKLWLIHSFLAWINTKIILDTADPDYINTMGKGEGVTGDMKTSDGGKTWTVSRIDIPEYSF